MRYRSKYNQAEDIYRQTLEVRERVLSLEHSNTLWSMRSLGWILFWRGKYKEAEALFQQVFKIHKKVLGQEHPCTASGRGNVAYSIMETTQLRRG